jgi:hypothetical protein
MEEKELLTILLSGASIKTSENGLNDLQTRTLLWVGILTRRNEFVGTDSIARRLRTNKEYTSYLLRKLCERSPALLEAREGVNYNDFNLYRLTDYSRKNIYTQTLKIGLDKSKQFPNTQTE